MPKKLNLTGQRFERLLVLHEGEVRNTGSRNIIYWTCKCDCGVVKDVRSASLMRGDIKSCGCYNKDVKKEWAKDLHKFRKNIVSSRKGAHKTREYHIWQSMKQRCYNPNSKIYPYYGGKGIGMCKAWRESFDTFYNDIGKIQKPLEIDRIDGDWHYEPNNVRITTHSVNVKNRDYVAIMAKRTRNAKGQFS